MIHFNYPEAFEYLMAHKEVYTLREHQKAEGIHLLVSKLFLVPTERFVRLSFEKFVRKRDELKAYLSKSGYGTVEAWVKAAHGAPFLHYVILLDKDYAGGESLVPQGKFLREGVRNVWEEVVR